MGSETERGEAIMRNCEEEERGRGWEKDTSRGRERKRGRKEASDFSSVTDGFHLTASMSPCLHKKNLEMSP